MDEGGTCWIAVQYGNLVVVPPWLDLNYTARLEGSFTISMYEGNIKGITDEVAFLLAEQSTPAEPFLGELSDLTEYATDCTTAKVRHVNFRADAAVYRRMTIIMVEKSLRVVDISAAMNHISLSVRPSCVHGDGPDTLPPTNLDHRLVLCGLPYIISSWGLSKGGLNDDLGTANPIHIKATHLLDSAQRYRLPLHARPVVLY